MAFTVNPWKHSWSDILVSGDDTNDYWYARLHLVFEKQDKKAEYLSMCSTPMAYVRWYDSQPVSSLCTPERDGIPLDLCPRICLTPDWDIIPVDSIITRISVVPDLKGTSGKDFILLGPYKGIFPTFCLA